MACRFIYAKTKRAHRVVVQFLFTMFSAVRILSCIVSQAKKSCSCIKSCFPDNWSLKEGHAAMELAVIGRGHTEPIIWSPFLENFINLVREVGS
jgi:hypothetical protein